SDSLYIDIVGGDINMIIDNNLDALPTRLPYQRQDVILWKHWTSLLQLVDVQAHFLPFDRRHLTRWYSVDGGLRGSRIDQFWVGDWLLNGTNNSSVWPCPISDHFALTIACDVTTSNQPARI